MIYEHWESQNARTVLIIKYVIHFIYVIYYVIVNRALLSDATVHYSFHQSRTSPFELKYTSNKTTLLLALKNHTRKNKTTKKRKKKKTSPMSIYIRNKIDPNYNKNKKNR
jgi:hypothetical protein